MFAAITQEALAARLHARQQHAPHAPAPHRAMHTPSALTCSAPRDASRAWSAAPRPQAPSTIPTLVTRSSACDASESGVPASASDAPHSDPSQPHASSSGGASAAAAPAPSEASPAATPSSPGQGLVAVQGDDLPEELRGVTINEAGDLVDPSGKVINEFGATRFDVQVRALRGELDPPAWREEENNERSPGILLGALVQFPHRYLFQVVSGKLAAAGGPAAAAERESFVEDVRSVIARVTQEEVPPETVTATDRLGGRYVSLKVEAWVRAPEVIGMVLEELGKDPRVKMKY